MKLQTKEELFIVIILIFISTLIENKIIVKLLGIENERLKDKTELKLLLIQASLFTINKLIFANKYSVIFNIIISIFLYKKILRITSEEAILSEMLNYIVELLSVLLMKPNVTIKILEEIFLVDLSGYRMIINFTVTSAITIIIRLVLIGAINHKNLKIEIGDFIKVRTKAKIILLQITSIAIVTITSIELTSYSNITNSILYYQTALIIISYFAISIYNTINLANNDKEEKLVEELEDGNKRLEDNYDNVRSFRHDFNNIMQGIGGYIVANDMDGLKDMYSSIIKECEEISNKQAINKEIINNPAIYSLINDKVRLAQKDGVSLKINVYIDLNTLNISSYDLCRMLGILIDNAIESAKVCEEKVVYIKFIKDKLNNRNLVVVENPYKNYLIDIKKIYEKGISSKKDKVMHGLGLWRVKQILKKNKNVLLYTSREKMFKQQVEIY